MARQSVYEERHPVEVVVGMSLSESTPCIEALLGQPQLALQHGQAWVAWM